MQSPSIPRVSPLHLHPVEAFLALLLLSVSALHRLVVDPPRPIRSQAAPGWGDEMLDALLQAQAIRQPQFDADWTCQPQASAAPAVGIAPGPTVAELRTMARLRDLSHVGGRPIHKARRADLIAVLFPPHLNNG